MSFDALSPLPILGMLRFRLEMKKRLGKNIFNHFGNTSFQNKLKDLSPSPIFFS
jgi:hypothetical protein